MTTCLIFTIFLVIGSLIPIGTKCASMLVCIFPFFQCNLFLMFIFSLPSSCPLTARCALLTCNNWGTVSTSYLYDLLRTNPLSALLYRFPTPFGKCLNFAFSLFFSSIVLTISFNTPAHSNGIRVAQRRALLATIAPSHEEAKRLLQKKYFAEVDPSILVTSYLHQVAGHIHYSF